MIEENQILSVLVSNQTIGFLDHQRLHTSLSDAMQSCQNDCYVYGVPS